MKNTTRTILILLFSMGVGAALVGCSGGTGGATGNSADSTSGTGTVGLLLTDKPADPSQFVSINATIESAELLGADEDDRVTLFSGASRTFDLLRLRSESIPLTFRDNVPTGTYCKIRLTLSDLELVLADNTPADMTDNDTYHPHLPGNGKLDLVSRACFLVAPGEVVTLQIDLDATNSFHVNKNRNGFIFRPVIFVDVLNQNFQGKLVRLTGEVARVDESGSRLLLCNALPSTQMNNNGCVIANFGVDSAFFDNMTYGGAPRPLDELLTADNVGEELTIVGWYDHVLPGYADVEVPDGYYPEDDECILWDISLPAAQQPEPIDCEDVPPRLPINTVLVTEDGVEHDRDRAIMSLDALVAELGDFLQVEGEVESNADSSGFTMNIGPGSPVVTTDPLNVMLQQGGVDYNGTRIISKSGELLDSTNVIVPLPVQVDGTLELLSSTDPLLKAALVILDTDALGSEQLTGKVLTVGSDMLTLDPDAAAVCGTITDDLAVTLAENTDILTVTITDSGSEIQPGGTLAVDQVVGMNGVCEPSGYITDNVVIVDDQR